MKILIIGGGGREHALAWRFVQEGHTICAAPGNPGIAQLGEVIAGDDYLAIAEHIQPDLTVVGPEGPLAAGIVAKFIARGRKPIDWEAELAAEEVAEGA